AARPFQSDGGLKLLTGNLGRAVIKVSAVSPERRRIRAPARVFHDQDALLDAFKHGELEQDMVAVLRFQGPRANGMPELHQLTPALSVLQDRGFQVALVTDGRMSGASGKVPAAIHVTPEAAAGGPLARVRDGDMILVDAVSGRLQVEVDHAEWAIRSAELPDLDHNNYGSGRELFAGLRSLAGAAENGASTFCHPLWQD
ncbi:MAG: dihydroxy-acid dehydratase, partial [Craterilacuibacter sp.]